MNDTPGSVPQPQTDPKPTGGRTPGQRLGKAVHLKGALLLTLLLVVSLGLHFPLGKPAAAGAPSPTGRTPKLLWTAERQEVWNRMVGENHIWWQRLKRWADGTEARDSDIGDYATLAYQMTGDVRYARRAWEIMRPYVSTKTLPYNSPNHTMWNFITWVWMYDWLYPGLTPSERATYIDFLNWMGDLVLNKTGVNWVARMEDSDIAVGHYFGLAFLSLATAPDNPRAAEFLNTTWPDRGGRPVGGLTATGANWDTLRNTIAYFCEQAKGGVWLEGSEYNLLTPQLLLIGAEGVRTATGKDYFPEVTELLPQLAIAHIQHHTPDMKDSYQWGDLERFRSLWMQHRVSLSAILAGLTQHNGAVGPYAQQLLDELAASPLDGGWGSKPFPRFFLFYNPYAPAANWRGVLPKGHYAPGYGLMYFHNDWFPNDSLFGAHAPTTPDVDHEVWAFGNFQLYRQGEWAVTNPLGWQQWEGYVGGDAHNAMLFQGLSSMREARGPVAQEFGPNGEYAYLAGSTGGQLYWEGFWMPPTPFLNEWTRSTFYLPSTDKQSDTIIVYDRTNAENPKALPHFDRYLYGYSDLVNNASALKQWIVHMPVVPTLTADAISWQTPGGQNVRVNTLLPANQKRQILDEKVLWKSVANYMVPAEERKYQVRIVPAEERQWDTFLNVVQAYNSGTAVKNTLLKGSAGEPTEGVLVQRAAHNDVAVLFSAKPSVNIPKTNLPDGRVVHNPDLLRILGNARLLQTGYTCSWTATAAGTELYLLDLDPRKSWQVRVDQGATTRLSVSSQGVGRLTVNGAGTHTLQLSATDAPNDTTPPATPTGLSATPGNTQATVRWNANTESDLAGYHLYRSTTEEGSYARQSTTPISGTTQTQTGLTNGTTYWYKVSAVDTSGNESPLSAAISVVPVGASTYTISGKVSAGTNGLSGVTVTAGSTSTTTAADGTYTLSGLTAGSYTVTAAKTGYDVTPASRSVTVGPNQTGVDFSATPQAPSTYSIRGKVSAGTSGLSGVTVRAGSQSTTTAANGTYTLSGLPAGTYSVSASRAEYTFNGPRSVTLGPDQSGIDFTGTRLTYAVRGRVTVNGTGLSGVTVTAGSTSTTTAADGSYTLSGLTAGTYSITPARSGYGFTPANRSVTVGPDQTGIDFSATTTGGLRGDLNRNGIIDVGDIQLIVNVFLGEDSFDPSLHDLNANGVIDIGDVQMLVNLYLGTSGSSASTSAAQWQAEAKKGPVKTFKLDFNPNTEPITAIGFDVDLGSGTLEWVKTGLQRADLQFTYSLQSEGRVRVLLYSTNGTPIPKTKNLFVVRTRKAKKIKVTRPNSSAPEAEGARPNGSVLPIPFRRGVKRGPNIG